jgi:hypothetical protein
MVVSHLRIKGGNLRGIRSMSREGKCVLITPRLPTSCMNALGNTEHQKEKEGESRR